MDIRYQKAQMLLSWLMPCIETPRSSLTQRSSGLSDSSLKTLREGTHMLTCPSQLVPGTALVGSWRGSPCNVRGLLLVWWLWQQWVYEKSKSWYACWSRKPLIPPALPISPKFWLLSPLQAWCLSCHMLFLPNGFLSSQGLLSVKLVLPYCLCSVSACYWAHVLGENCFQISSPQCQQDRARGAKCLTLVLLWKHLICLSHGLSWVSQTCSLQLMGPFPL